MSIFWLCDKDLVDLQQKSNLQQDMHVSVLFHQTNRGVTRWIDILSHSHQIWMTHWYFASLPATTVGGGYINGTAESIAKDGLVWTLAPFGIFIGLISGMKSQEKWVLYRESISLTFFLARLGEINLLCIL